MAESCDAMDGSGWDDVGGSDPRFCELSSSSMDGDCVREKVNGGGERGEGSLGGREVGEGGGGGEEEGGGGEGEGVGENPIGRDEEGEREATGGI